MEGPKGTPDLPQHKLSGTEPRGPPKVSARGLMAGPRLKFIINS